jgi:hypothetical protein
MRIIVILAAASVTFVATPPVSAEQRMVHTCKTEYQRCMKRLQEDIDGGPAGRRCIDWPGGSSACMRLMTAIELDQCNGQRSACLDAAAKAENPLTHPRLPPDYHGKDPLSDKLILRSEHKTLRTKNTPESSEPSTPAHTSTRRTGTPAGGPIK